MKFLFVSTTEIKAEDYEQDNKHDKVSLILS